MFTLFHVFSLVGLLLGLIGGYHLGHHFGLFIGLGGALVGGWLGFHAGNLPFLVSTWFIHYQFRVKPTSQLWNDLHTGDCLMPNMVLRELKRRGEPMAEGSSVVSGSGIVAKGGTRRSRRASAKLARDLKVLYFCEIDM